MYKPSWNAARVPGFPAASLLACLALFLGSCSQNHPMTTNPSTHLSATRLADSGRASSVIPALGTAASFAVLGGSTVTSTGLSVLTGDLGVSPGAAITGFGPGVVSGTIHAGDPVAAQAQSDLTTAYNALAGVACNTDLTGQDLGGKTLAPGVYCFSSSAGLTGTLVLDGRGDPNAVFIFQIASSLTTATNSSVVMINNGNVCNVFWQVGSSATLGTGTVFAGNILAYASVTLNTGVRMSGRALARVGAVTMDTDTVSVADCGRGGDGKDDDKDKCGVKVTGGGSIHVTGGIASFGFNVRQVGDGRVEGELEYVNHASGRKVHIRQFTTLRIVGRTATFAGSGSIDGLPGSAIVTVTDEGEPGRNDRFSIAISDDPADAGTLRSGNIRFHEEDCHDGDRGGRGHDDGEDHKDDGKDHK